jgi:hypothetical protein
MNAKRILESQWMGKTNLPTFARVRKTLMIWIRVLPQICHLQMIFVHRKAIQCEFQARSKFLRQNHQRTNQWSGSRLNEVRDCSRFPKLRFRIAKLLCWFLFRPPVQSSTAFWIIRGFAMFILPQAAASCDGWISGMSFASSDCHAGIDWDVWCQGVHLLHEPSERHFQADHPLLNWIDVPASVEIIGASAFHVRASHWIKSRFLRGSKSLRLSASADDGRSRNWLIRDGAHHGDLWIWTIVVNKSDGDSCIRQWH